MKLEHTALQVSHPVEMAQWYARNLGMVIVRAQDAAPFGHFLADANGTAMLELYRHPAVTVPDYRAMDPLVLHVAFVADDIAATRTRLLAAGATPEADIQTTPAGDQLTMLRDPWGLALQLATRANAMV
jgi:catechol 2,3-dioxygenase-like lactoylglutathione lyase family enzyme